MLYTHCLAQFYWSVNQLQFGLGVTISSLQPKWLGQDFSQFGNGDQTWKRSDLSPFLEILLTLREGLATNQIFT